MTNQQYASTAGRAGNAALLVTGMMVLFFTTSAVIITVPTTWQYLPFEFVVTIVFLKGVGGMLLYFWLKTRPIEEDE